MASIPDEFGIVTKRMHDRKTYARFVEKSVGDKLATRAVQKAITRMVDQKFKKEIGAIVAARTALALADAIRPPPGPKPDVILKAVSEATGYSVNELLGPRRARPTARARMLAYHILKMARPDLSLPAIGRVMGYRDHTTIMHGLGKFQEVCGDEPTRTWLAHPAIVELLKSP